MRHRKKEHILGRERAPRKALMRSLAEGLVLHESIETTLAKAKALRVFIEPLVTKAAKGKNPLVVRRKLQQVLYTDRAINKMIKDIAPRYKERPGGYTRIVKLGHRASDAADTARIEFVS